eukprot:CAMPEP_0178996236 /NCGR_PEP_ID=MMETSP0795-20121207/8266_1 /TAXON_ID=88552 /ORGANISM="Amoebophrya sp., Strain Ameob2" /LENGTH=514 /DNA_ID=CAMNT_0020688623 /DNA_START=22 /DNA_END=1566 /DNA_ORIENTATION=+
MGMLDELDLRIDLSQVREAAARYGLQLAGQQDENSAKSDSSADEVLPFTVQQLRATYRSKMLAHHPDKGGDPELFLEAHSDYSLLLEWWNLWMRKSGRNCSSRSAPPPPGTTASASAAAKETPTTFAENDFNVYIPPRGPGSGGGGGASSATSKLGGGGNPNPVGRAGAPTSRTSAFVLNPHPGNKNLHANSATSRSTTPAPSRVPADVPGNAASSPASSAASGSEEEDVEDLFRPVITELLKTRILGSNKAAKFAKHLAPAAEGEVEVGRAPAARDADEDSVAAEEPFDGVAEEDTELLAVRSTRRQTEAAGGDQLQCAEHEEDEQNSPSSGSSSSGTSEDSSSPNSESRTDSEAERTTSPTAGAANREASAAASVPAADINPPKMKHGASSSSPKDSVPSPAPGIDQASSSRYEECECDGNGNERESEGAESCSPLSSDERRGREASGSASTSPSKNLYRRGISSIVESIHKNRVRNLQQLGPSHTKALMSGRVQALLGRPPGHAHALQPLV